MFVTVSSSRSIIFHSFFWWGFKKNILW